jgi:hypothetical protein
VEIGLLLTLVALVATLASVAAARFWVADLAVHFRLQWAALALAGCLILAATGHPRWAALAFVVAAIQALLSAPLLNVRAPAPADPAACAAAPDGDQCLVPQSSVSARHRLHPRERPDVVLLAEVTAKWEQALAPLNAELCAPLRDARPAAARDFAAVALADAGRDPARLFRCRAGDRGDLVIKDRRVQLLERAYELAARACELRAARSAARAHRRVRALAKADRSS